MKVYRRRLRVNISLLFLVGSKSINNNGSGDYIFGLRTFLTLRTLNPIFDFDFGYRCPGMEVPNHYSV